jgi:hypothetical protein
MVLANSGDNLIMAQQKGMKRAAKVLRRKQKKRVAAKQAQAKKKVYIAKKALKEEAEHKHK